MWGIRRKGSARPGRASAVTVALAAVTVLSGAACGASEGSARPTAVEPSSTVAAPSTTGAPVARFATFSAPLYARGDNWLCGPEVAVIDRCLGSNQDTTIVEPGGQTRVRVSEPAADPAFDCFYALPFASLNAGDLVSPRDTTAEETVVFQEAARLREQCRVYVPLYRRDGAGARYAEGDVADAFRHYMARWNQGRHVVLFGHGEGADHLTRLLQAEFDGDPQLRSLLVAAYLIGGHTDTAALSVTGGDFQNIPRCSSPTEQGCVVGWAASSPSTPRSVAARWGEAPPGRVRLCTNPAAPAGGPGRLTAIVESKPGYVRAGTAITTPFIELPDVLDAECVTTGSVTTMVVRPALGDPAVEARDAAALIQAPSSDLHPLDVPLALGSIMQLMARQSATLD